MSSSSIPVPGAQADASTAAIMAASIYPTLGQRSNEVNEIARAVQLALQLQQEVARQQAQAAKQPPPGTMSQLQQDVAKLQTSLTQLQQVLQEQAQATAAGQPTPQELEQQLQQEFQTLQKDLQQAQAKQNEPAGAGGQHTAGKSGR